MNYLKEVPLHALITSNTFQFKLKNITNVACFHGQHFSRFGGYSKIPLVLLAFAITLKEFIPKRVIKGQKKIKIRSYESRGKSYIDIRLIHIMSTDSLRSMIGVNIIIEKMSFYFRKHS